MTVELVPQLAHGMKGGKDAHPMDVSARSQEWHFSWFSRFAYILGKFHPIFVCFCILLRFWSWHFPHRHWHWAPTKQKGVISTSFHANKAASPHPRKLSFLSTCQTWVRCRLRCRLNFKGRPTHSLWRRGCRRRMLEFERSSSNVLKPPSGGLRGILRPALNRH